MVSFHDSTLLSVEEKPGYIHMEIDSACVRSSLIGAEGEAWTLQECSLQCYGVEKNEKEEWDDTRTAKPCSNPSLPIEQILENEVIGTCFELAGFTLNNNWGVWRIEAKEYDLNWKTKVEFKRT
jgi:hypothetical protein